MSLQMQTERKSSELSSLGEGEMARRIQAFDWSKTPLGPMSSWSPALRTTLRILLANRFPHILWWGPQYIQFYNDPYRPYPGTKHPDKALGQPASQCWPEIWHVIGPLIDRPFHGGPATWDDDIALELYRHGYLEESHFVIAYSPVPDDTVPGGIGGVLATVHEITQKIVGERRVRALRDLGARVGEAHTAEEACAIAAETLAAHAKDVPFAQLYLIDESGERARLAGMAGVRRGKEVLPPEIDLQAPDPHGWPVGEVIRTGTTRLVDRLVDRLPAVPPGPWSDPPDTAALVPIPSHKPGEPAGVMVLGVSARLQFDDAYRDFFDLVKTQIATAIANARAYEEEKKRAEALAEVDRVKTAFFSNVSHEFRTPLTLMLGPIEEMLDHGATALSPADRTQLEVVNRNGLRLLRLVNTLLDFSRIEAGRVHARYQPTDLAALTCDLASVFRSAVERAGLELVLDCPPMNGPVYVDREMWEKVVLNLLSNAFKYTFEGEIGVSLRDHADTVELAVWDTGTGIPAEEMPRLFERFHRVRNARGRTHEGSGIGLALVQELVRLHGGVIGATSVPGRGTRFSITVPTGIAHLPADQIVEDEPLARVEDAAIPYVEEALRWLPDDAGAGPDTPAIGTHSDQLPAQARLHAAIGEKERVRVLVADDNADMRQYLTRLLAARYEVEAVADGRAALEAARERTPDLVLTDVMMPRLDGFGLLREMRSEESLRDTPLIMVSARAGEESRVEGVQAGADDYLVKPFSARELLARVDAHLKLSRLRREAREAIRYRGEQFETLLNAAPLGMFLLDADLRFVEVNPVAIPVFGEPPDGLLGREYGEVLERLLAPPDADAVVSTFRKTLESGDPFVERERAVFRVDRGVTEYYEWRVDRTTLPDGRYGLVCYFQDISEHVEARREREHLLEAEQSARQEAERANRLKDDFLATLSHELRTPLNAMLGWSQILQRRKDDAPIVEQGIAAIGRSALAQTQLIEDLLDTSRIISGKLRLDLRRTHVAEVVAAAVESVMPSANAKHLRVTRSLDALAYVMADPARLQQVVWNLLTNAVKFTPDGGGVDVAVGSRDGRVAITVRDTGVGIPPDFLPVVFDRFRQADASHSRRYGGLGIGLTLVKQLVELHGGAVRAESEGDGSGATFVVTLPLADERGTEEPGQPSRGRLEDAVLDGVRVLYVDDDPDARELGERILGDRAAEVRVARSAREALELLEAEPPDVLVCDIGLPEIDGYELIRRVRQLPPAEGGKTPAVALTAFARPEDRRRALIAGYQSHVAKPVVPEDLVAVVATLAGRWRPTRS
jgi:PAS domain S-box-containing protein